MFSRVLRWPSLLCFLLLAARVVPAHAAPDPTSSKALAEFLDAEWNWTMEQNPTWASRLGDRRWNDRWGDESLAAHEARHAHEVETLRQLPAKISREALSPADQLNYDLFARNLQERIEGHRFRAFLAPVNQLGGPQSADNLAAALRFDSAKDYEDWLARLAAFPAQLAQVTELLREGVRARVLPAKIVLERVSAQVARQIVAEPRESGFYRPFTRLPASIPAGEAEALQARAAKLIEGGIVPAFREFQRFLESEYLPACFDAPGAWQEPEGEAFYAFQARRYTTTNLAPAAIHELGLREVARIRGEMEKVMAQVGWKGTRAEFFAHLRTDPQFFYASGDELLLRYRDIAKRADPLLVRVFKTLPRTPYGVEPVPAALAPDQTTAYYEPPAADGSRAGTYRVNLY